MYPSQEEADRCIRIMYHIMKNLPPKDWLLKLLCAINPEDEIFLKGYYPPKTAK